MGSTCWQYKEARGPARGTGGQRDLLGRGVQADTCRQIRDGQAKGDRGWAGRTSREDAQGAEAGLQMAR